MLSVIVPVYPVNEKVRSYVLECVRRIVEYTEGDYELVVIQNGGEVLPLTQAKRWFIYKPEPIGFARALNLGLSLADGDLLALVSADVWLPAGWNRTLERELAAHGPGYICPHSYGPKGTHEWWGWGAAWLTTRDVFTHVGYDDELLNHRYSDMDRWIRAKQKGYHILNTDLVPCQHFLESTVSQMPERFTEWPKEQTIMMARYGCDTYAAWLEKNK